MPAPTPTNSVTVDIGSENEYVYVASYRGMHAYQFYRGAVRWMLIQRLRIDPDIDSHLAVFRSDDDGQTWSLSGGLGPVRDGADIGAPAYDIRVASGMAHGLAPDDIDGITALYAKESTSPAERHLAYVDFDFSGSWGAPYGDFDVATPLSALDFCSAPNDAKAYALLQSTSWSLNGVSAGAGSGFSGIPSGLIVGADSLGYASGSIIGAPNISNVRIVGGSLVYATSTGGVLQVVTRSLSGSSSAETVGPASGLIASGANRLWLRGNNRVYWIGADKTSLYRSVKRGGAWQTAERLWYGPDDGNSDVYSGVGVETFQPCVSDSNQTGYVDVALDTYLNVGGGQGTITFRAAEPNYAARYYGSR